ncbi:hypothetical protein CEXT_706871 [Caerostris extrusa]|uniref:Uncharacterized protein n=1 Tax=Caerostris extrusa TaxID=172846 RepID=A0AAV4PXL4_CAEEX|nr:hypothetical protein CEXT_706871 [Caerostris extrusa]
MALAELLKEAAGAHPEILSQSRGAREDRSSRLAYRPESHDRFGGRLLQQNFNRSECILSGSDLEDLKSALREHFYLNGGGNHSQIRRRSAEEEVHPNKIIDFMTQSIDSAQEPTLETRIDLCESFPENNNEKGGGKSRFFSKKLKEIPAATPFILCRNTNRADRRRAKDLGSFI